MPRRRFSPVAVVLVLALAAATAPASAGVSTPTRWRSSGSITWDGGVAAKALHTAQQALTGSTAPDAGRSAGGPGAADPTMALRDLSLARADLPPRLQDDADAVLARPTDDDADPQGDGYTVPEQTPSCSREVCVHYVATSRDRPRDVEVDADDNGVPDWVDLTRTTFSHVHDVYVGAGWQAPRRDGRRGGNGRTDVYLADLDSRGLYGYCVSDQRGVDFSRHVRTWAYCVVDNDYANVAANTPTENLQVTAAHEYLHAIQFGYDYGEDAWLYEATATWAEDELYDDVDDNAQFLRFSPLTRPGRSMDRFAGLLPFGDWIYFRFLTELAPDSQGGLPTLVRDVWRRAAVRGPHKPGAFSIRAVETALLSRGIDPGEAFASFVAANRDPRHRYDEGTEQDYPSARPARTHRLGGRRTTSNDRLVVDHLASATVRYVATHNRRGKLLRVHVTGPRTPGAWVAVVARDTGGGTEDRVVRLRHGRASIGGLAFTTPGVAWVEVSVVNAGTRYRCDRGTPFSCHGVPVDDGAEFRLSARVGHG